MLSCSARAVWRGILASRSQPADPLADLLPSCDLWDVKQCYFIIILIIIIISAISSNIILINMSIKVCQT